VMIPCIRCKKPIEGAKSVGRLYCDDCKDEIRKSSQREYKRRKKVKQDEIIPVGLRLNSSKKYYCEECGSPCYYKRCRLCAGKDSDKTLSRLYNRRGVTKIGDSR